MLHLNTNAQVHPRAAVFVIVKICKSIAEELVLKKGSTSASETASCKGIPVVISLKVIPSRDKSINFCKVL